MQMNKTTNTPIMDEDMQIASKHETYSTSTNRHQENIFHFYFYYVVCVGGVAL